MEGGQDGQAAAWLAEQAGQVLLALQAAHELPTHAQEQARQQLRDAGDAGSHQWLMRQLARLHPGDAVLSEEGADDPVRLTAQRVWIIDPLDGTREYGEGRDDWAVHVALWQEGDVVAGAVALPARGQVWVSDGACLPALSAPSPTRWRVAVSRTRPPALLDRVAHFLAHQPDPVLVEYVAMGSAGVKIAAVVEGRVEAYLHAGGQYEWDSAAPVAVARASGLHTSRVDGSPLRYNQPDPSLPDLLVCHPHLSARLLEAVAQVSAAPTPDSAPDPQRGDSRV